MVYWIDLDRIHDDDDDDDDYGEKVDDDWKKTTIKSSRESFESFRNRRASFAKFYRSR